jgi:2-iminobutanoate/2-iminopropanoate deaminase
MEFRWSSDMAQTINTDRFYSEAKLFSQGMVADEFTFLAVDARGPHGSINRSAGAEEQCRQAMRSLRSALNSVGQDLQDLVSVMVFLPDYSDAERVSAALQAELSTAQSSPAITLVGVWGLEDNCRVRMDAIVTRHRDQLRPILLDNFPLATGARCHGVRAHDFVFLSGVDAADCQGKGPAPVTIQSQTKVVLNRIETILGDQKLTLSDLCRTFMFMPSTEYRPGYGEARKAVYQGIFSEDEFPPNSGIYIRDLGPDILLRSVAVAYAGKKTIVASPKVRKAPGSFSQSVRVGDWLLMAGQDAVGFDRVVEAEGDLAGQTQVTLQHIQDIVEEAGGSLDDVVKTTVYLVAGQDRPTFSAAYQKFFQANKRHSSMPTGLTVEVRELSPRCLIEIDAVALLR